MCLAIGKGTRVLISPQETRSSVNALRRICGAGRTPHAMVIERDATNSDSSMSDSPASSSSPMHRSRPDCSQMPVSAANPPIAIAPARSPREDSHHASENERVATGHGRTAMRLETAREASPDPWSLKWGARRRRQHPGTLVGGLQPDLIKQAGEMQSARIRLSGLSSPEDGRTSAGSTGDSDFSTVRPRPA